MDNETLYKNLNICIRDNGELYDLHEIITELKDFHVKFDTHSMNESVLFKQGQKDMLDKVVNYLERIAGTE